MPEANLHFPKADTAAYRKSWNAGVRCAVMQGGQGDVKHWAFNDPPRRDGKYKDEPPSPAEYRKLATRVVDLHPLTIAQNARTSGGGNISLVPTQAITVGPGGDLAGGESFHLARRQPRQPLRPAADRLMIAKKLADAAVPMSLLADHPNVQFNYYRKGVGTCAVEMH